MKVLRLDSTFLPEKCVDRISELPDEILVHILSFLTLKKAGATSVLSSRWSDLWKYIPKLNFLPKDFGGRSTAKHIEWVNSVVNSYKAPSLKQFTVGFDLNGEQPDHHIAKWLCFAFSRRVEMLGLSFGASPYILDSNISCNIKTNQFLKELNLFHVNVSGEALELILCNSPLLERLSIRATLTSDLRVVSGTLKHVILYSGRSRGSVKISSPSLNALQTNYPVQSLFLENVPNLIDASFRLVGVSGTMHYFAKAAANFEILTIFLRHPMAFPVPRMRKLKKLVLYYGIVNKHFQLPVTSLLQSSPYLQEFRLEISDSLHKYYNGIRNKECIFEIPKCGRYPHYHLNVFTFSRFCSSYSNHMELLTYIVDNCVALQEIIIVPILFRASEEAAIVSSNIKKQTEQLLATKLPNHIKLRVD